MRPNAARRDRVSQLRREYRSRGIHLMPASVALFAPIPTRGRPATLPIVMSAELARRLATLGQS